MGRHALLKSRIFAIVFFIAAATTAPCLALKGGVQAGAGGSLFYGGWVQDTRDEVYVLGATDVTNRIVLLVEGGWLGRDPGARLSLCTRGTEPRPVGGALLASGGYDMLVGVTAIELAVPVLAVTRIGVSVGRSYSALAPLSAEPSRSVRSRTTV